jgi:hypothetical protein
LRVFNPFQQKYQKVFFSLPRDSPPHVQNFNPEFPLGRTTESRTRKFDLVVGGRRRGCHEFPKREVVDGGGRAESKERESRH